MLLRAARLVPVGGAPAPAEPVDVRLGGGRITAVGRSLSPEGGEEVVDGDGRYAVPGLWDKHVHLAQWAGFRRRLDTSGTRCAADVLALVAARLTSLADDAVLVGYGHRTGTWPQPPSVADLDAVCGSRAVVLISGDAHHAWLSTSALRLLGVPDPLPAGPLEEEDWFSRYPRLAEVTPPPDPTAYADAVQAASALGVVGVVDLEFDSDFLRWPDRWLDGVTGLRVRSATYADGLPAVAAMGLRSGDPLLIGQDHVVMGPLKIISDGSLNTRTALCCTPYADPSADPAGTLPLPDGSSATPAVYGRANYDAAELTDLLSQARTLGLDATVHAIGDQALHEALLAFDAAGDWAGRPSGAARGSIEHAQLVAWEDLDTMADLGLTASVQPAHLLDDRDVTEQCWPDRTDRCFAFRAMLERGIPLALGSDAPVSPLDPWLAMAAAVHRSADDRGPWHAEQALTVAEALACSADGVTTLAEGGLADIALLGADPLAPQSDSAATAAHLRGIRVEATLVAGRFTHRTF